MRIVLSLVMLILLVCLSLSIAKKKSQHIFRARAFLQHRSYIRPLRRVRELSQTHTVVFALKQRNLDQLEALLLAVSDPHSVSYGEHWTSEEVGALVRNPEAAQQLLSYLQTHFAGKVKIVQRSLHDEFIVAQASLAVWETLLATSFHEFAHSDWGDVPIVRALEYSLPSALDMHISSVGNVVDFPNQLRESLVFNEMNPHSQTVIVKNLNAINNDKDNNNGNNSSNSNTTTDSLGALRPNVDNGLFFYGAVTPALIREHYHVFNSTGNALTSQAVYSTIGQTLSPRDLAQFQDFFGVPRQPIAQAINGFVDDNACAKSILDCIEANLDFQYLMSTAQNVPTTSFYDNYDSWYRWMVAASSMSNPPKVFSVSYGAVDFFVSPEIRNAFNIESMKLGLQGVSLLVASGDDGALGFGVNDGSLPCDYWPDFPAVSPYWTVVGGTMGPEFRKDEVVCSSSAGGAITSGGGFSDTFPTPAWQRNSVNGYFKLIENATIPTPETGYNAGGRGYPDVSLLANNYIIIANGSLIMVAGTSASSPVFAGFVSLINAARARQGLPSMGFLNPFLYANAGSFVNDITVGDIKCTRDERRCCPQGFTATPGWDPASGLGAVDFTRFFQAAVGEESVSVSPSPRPTTSLPSLLPSRSPSRSPSRDPTVTPTMPPSLTPSVVPSAFPSLLPSVVPSVVPSPIPAAAPSLAPSSVVFSVSPSFAPSIAPSDVSSASPSAASADGAVPSQIPSAPPSSLTVVLPSMDVSPSLTPSLAPSLLSSIFSPSQAPAVDANEQFQQTASPSFRAANPPKRPSSPWWVWSREKYQKKTENRDNV